MYTRDRAQFRARVTVEEGGCWRLPLELDDKGYTRINSKLAHRIAYRLFVGPIRNDLPLDHLCRNRWCVNPEHLEAVTNRENLLRSPAPNFAAARNGTCMKGHERVRSRKPSGSFQPCRECHRERMATDPEYAEKIRARKRLERTRWRERHRAATAA